MTLWNQSLKNDLWKKIIIQKEDSGDKVHFQTIIPRWPLVAVEKAFEFFFALLLMPKLVFG